MRRFLTILLVNNGSIFLWDIIHFLKSRRVVTVRVDPLKFDTKRLNTHKIDGVILSGGPEDYWVEKSNFNKKMIRKMSDKPLLGICLGHEFLVNSDGGVIYRMNYKAKGNTIVHIIKDNELIQKKKTIKGFKGHKFAGGVLPDSFEQLGWSRDCEHEMIKHRKRLHFGVQFHPEKNKKDGYEILDNFIKLCRNQRHHNP